jgi:hypothetical protein
MWSRARSADLAGVPQDPPVQLGVQRSINASPAGIENGPLPLYVPRAIRESWTN